MAGFTDYEAHDAVGLAALVARGETTPEEVLEAAVERVDARDGIVNAVTNRLYDLGRQAIADGLPDGPLKGVPYLLKDLGASLAGCPTTRGCRFFEDVVPAEDSEHVKRLKRAGMVIFGRTNTCELGLSLTCEPRLHGATKNPWDPARISGGSSGGAAAAVGARMLPAAHASDGFGSIRAPAACCGLVGLKPTRGRNTMAPYLGEGSGGLSTEHAVTLSVRDSAAILDATRGPGAGDPYSAAPPARPFLDEVGADPGRLRIAFTTPDPERRPGRGGGPAGARGDRNPCRGSRTPRRRGRSRHRRRSGGADLPHPDGGQHGGQPVEPPERRPGGPRGRGRTDHLADGEAGRSRERGADYVRATQTMHRLGRQMAAFHRDHDLLLTPGLATGTAVKLGWLDMMMEDVDEYWRRVFHFSPFTVWFNLTGQPAAMLPIGESADGLPVAVQAVAPYGDEAALFRFAAQLESARPWFGRKPAMVRETA